MEISEFLNNFPERGCQDEYYSLFFNESSSGESCTDDGWCDIELDEYTYGNHGTIQGIVSLKILFSKGIILF